MAVFLTKSKKLLCCEICRKIHAHYLKKRSIPFCLSIGLFKGQYLNFSYPENELWNTYFKFGLKWTCSLCCYTTRYIIRIQLKIYFKYEYLLRIKRNGSRYMKKYMKKWIYMFWKMKLERNWKNLILIKFLDARELSISN